MASKTMHEKITKILQNTFNIDKVDAEKDLHRDDVYKWDSLTHMDLITTIEREFNISLTLDDIVEMSSLSKIRNIIKSNTN